MPGHGLGEVGFVDDIVAVEHAVRLPAAEPHDDPLGEARPAHRACGRAPEVVDAGVREPCALPGPLPPVPRRVVGDRLPVPVKYVIAVPGLPLRVEQRLEIGGRPEGEDPGYLGLREGSREPDNLPVPRIRAIS